MTIPISVCLVLLKNILIGHLNHSNRIINEQVMAEIRKLVESGKQSITCTSTCARIFPRMWAFLHFFFIFFYLIQLYTSYTPQNHSKFILKSQFYSIHLSLHVYLQKPFMNYFQTTLIWVITHTQPKHQDLLGFVLNPNSIPCNLNHESIPKP